MLFSSARNYYELASVLLSITSEYFDGGVECPFIKFTNREMCDLSGLAVLSENYVLHLNIALIEHNQILLKRNGYWVLACCSTKNAISVHPKLLENFYLGRTGNNQKEMFPRHDHGGYTVNLEDVTEVNYNNRCPQCGTGHGVFDWLSIDKGSLLCECCGLFVLNSGIGKKSRKYMCANCAVISLKNGGLWESAIDVPGRGVICINGFCDCEDESKAVEEYDRLLLANKIDTNISYITTVKADGANVEFLRGSIQNVLNYLKENRAGRFS